MIYGYCRVSTTKQKIERQVANIKSFQPDILDKNIFVESYTGTKIDRPVFSKLLKMLEKDDTVIFDSVSRFSRDADEGFKLYQELFEKGVNLIFLNERHIDTEVFKQARDKKISFDVENDDNIIKLTVDYINNLVLEIAKRQIYLSFAQAQAEVDDLHTRTVQGIREARKKGKQIGGLPNVKRTTKKSIVAKEKILKHCKSFNGSLNDKECMEFCGIANNTYYKYKKELLEDDNLKVTMVDGKKHYEIVEESEED